MKQMYLTARTAETKTDYHKTNGMLLSACRDFYLAGPGQSEYMKEKNKKENR